MSVGALCVTPWVLWPLAAAMFYKEGKEFCAGLFGKKSAKSGINADLTIHNKYDPDKVHIMDELPKPEIKGNKHNVWRVDGPKA